MKLYWLKEKHDVQLMWKLEGLLVTSRKTADKGLLPRWYHREELFLGNFVHVATQSEQLVFDFS